LMRSLAESRNRKGGSMTRRSSLVIRAGLIAPTEAMKAVRLECKPDPDAKKAFFDHLATLQLRIEREDREATTPPPGARDLVVE